MACARCGCGVYCSEDKVTMNKIWHKCCFTCYNCNRSLDKCLAKVWQGEIYCCNCCPSNSCFLTNCDKLCRISSNPNCRITNCSNNCCEPSATKCRYYNCCPEEMVNCNRPVHSCSCIPDCAPQRDVICFSYPIPREVANYYNRENMKPCGLTCPSYPKKTFCFAPPNDSCCRPKSPCCINRPCTPRRCCSPPPSCCPRNCSPPPPPSCKPRRPRVCCSPVRYCNRQCCSPCENSSCEGEEQVYFVSRNCCPPCSRRPCSPCCDPSCAPQPPCRDCQPCPPPDCCCPKCRPCRPCSPSPCRPCSPICRPPRRRCLSPLRPPCCNTCCCSNCGNSKPCDCKYREMKEACTSYCVRCGCKVYIAEKVLVSCGAYHNSCFSCYSCRKMLTLSTVNEHCGEIFCKQCYNACFGTNYYRSVNN